jgi:UDP:flavonoid glycosyltransferase YjiC (YdhE family)
VIWSPEVPLPEWWDRVGRERPCVYVTLGSAGNVHLVPTVLEALGSLDVDVMLATAARYRSSDLPGNVHVAEFLPGHLAARRSSVVVCNGGASTAYQALAEGVPVVGLPFNLDAYLSMTAIRDASAGVLVRAGTATASAIREAVEHAMVDPPMRDAAKNVARAFARCDAKAAFRAFVEEVTEGSARSAGARS